MKLKLIFVGKTTDKFLQEGIELYLQKLKHYLLVDVLVIPSGKNRVQIKNEESDNILKHISSKDFVVLLDEKGKDLSSIDLSIQMQKWMNQSYKKVVFITGGAFGVDDRVRKRADFVWSFSHLTFTHQMIRPMLLEQLYRAMTILKGESYHHA